MVRMVTVLRERFTGLRNSGHEIPRSILLQNTFGLPTISWRHFPDGDYERAG
jgi:hypothetical protein